MNALAPYRIVVGIDFSPLAGTALEQALATAAARPSAEVHIVAVVEDAKSELVAEEERQGSLVDVTDRVRERLASLGTTALTSFHSSYAGSRQFPVIAHVRVGATAQQVVNLAGEIGADLIVIGTHGRRGLQRVIVGSVAERTVRLAPCPVLVVRPKDSHWMDGVPKADPACPSCVATRERTAGRDWWCEGHAVAPEPAHTFSHSRRLDQPPTSYNGR